MPTFYWVGKGCPKDGTSNSSHLWGTSEYDWNTPSNWVVAHSLHAHTLNASTYGKKGPTLTVLTEVYAIPNRCPGPGDQVYVGHYPWLKHYKYVSPDANESSDHFLETSLSPEANNSTNGFIGVNDTFFSRFSWTPDYDPAGILGAPGISRGPYASTSTVQQVLYRPINSSNGRVTTVQVPRALYGTSTTPLYKKFYATTTNSLNGGSVTPSSLNSLVVSEWWDGPSSWQNGELPAQIVTETNTVASILDYAMAMRNQYRLGLTYTLWMPIEMVKLPPKALAPLLWGGCVAGSTGITSSLGISGGSGNTFWINSGDGGANVLADKNQALDELNVILYGDRLPLNGKYLDVGGVTGPTSPGNSYALNFWDSYPFKSVGDGLFGEEFNTVVSKLQELNCSSPTGGFSTQIPDATCYNCVGATATARSTNLTRVTSRGLTAEGARATCLFVKAHNVNVRTPFEYNKYAGNNPLGKQKFREDAAMTYRISSTVKSGASTLGDSWMMSNLGVLPERNGCTDNTGDCAHGPQGMGSWVNSCRTCNDKYVEMRLAEFFTPGITAQSPENYKTVLHADMRFGQFNLSYGRVQEANLGTPHASYGNEYAEGTKSIRGISSYDDMGIGEWGTIGSLKNSLLQYDSYTFTPIQLANATTFINSNNNSWRFGLANPFWPSASTYFLGSNDSSEPTSRINRLNSFSVSATVNPMANAGVSRVFMSVGDTVEFMCGSLTSSGSNSYDYTTDMGSVFVNHGYPIVIGNNTGTVNAAEMGKFLFGSTMTGDRFYNPYISIKPLGINLSIGGGTGASGPISSNNLFTAKTAYTSPIFYAQVGDLTLDNTDFSLISPDSINYGIEKYGNKIIDRAFLKNDVLVDFRADDAAFLHFGRVLNAGSTGGTGSIYGGIIFQGETKQVVTPPAGSRFWVSKIDGNILDSRQTSVATTFVTTYYPEGQLSALGNFPNSLGAAGDVTSTGKNPQAYNKNDIFLYVKDDKIPMEQFGDIDGEVQAAAEY